MKIKVPPHDSAPQGQTIIIKEQREGCFLRTLNFGCIVFALLVALVFAILAWAFFTARSATQGPRRAPAPRSPQAAPASKPPTVDLYHFQESKDAMTDAVRYLFVWKSEKSRERFSVLSESLVLRFAPTQVERSSHRMKYEIECIIHADFSYVGRDKTTAIVRFDNKPAQSWKCTPSSTGEGLFIDDARAFLSEIAYARRCRVRFDDFGGKQHDLDFNLGFFSLQNFREKIVDCVLRSSPPNVKILD